MKRGISFALAALISVSAVLQVNADELKDKKNELNEVNEAIKEKKEKLEELEKDKKSAEGQLKFLDTRMDSEAEELDKLRDQISTTDNEISELGKAVEAKQKEVDEQQNLLDKRIYMMYKNGNTGYLNVLLRAKNFSDLFERAVLLKRVIGYDKKLIEGLKEDKAALEANKTDLEKKKSKLSSLKEQSDAKYKSLMKQSDQKKELVKELEKDKAQYQKLIEQEEADAKALKEKIKKIEASFKLTNGKMFCVTGTPYRITSPYGMRFHPVLKYNRFHAGMDIGVYWGTALYSLMDGIVVYSGSMSGYGKVVMINHGKITSLYAHNSSNVVQEGKVVKGGQLIAYSGNTGLSSGPHLHFEIRNANGDPINPTSYYIK